MPSTTTVRRWVGPGNPFSGTKADITGTNTRANAADLHSVADTTSPIQIPTSGTNYSYWVSTRLSVDVTPATLINNIKWFTDGTNDLGTSIGMVCAKANVGVDGGYRQAAGTPGVTGTQLTQANHSGLAEAPSNAFSFTSGSPKSLAGSMANPSVGDCGDFLVYSLTVGSTAVAGPTASQEVMTFSFDES